MKCIRMRSTGLVHRVSDISAETAVHLGEAVYVSKSVWKKETRDVSK